MTDVFTKIRSAREERVKDLHLDYEIPTWNGDFVARFRVLNRKAMERFSNAKRGAESDQDFVISAVESIWVRDADRVMTEGERMADNEDYVRVEKDGIPVKFDENLAQILQIEGVTTARQVLMHMFDGNAIAIGSLVMKLVRWMENTDKEISESLVGE